MSKIAIISDIHGNYAAFEAVWKRIKDFPLILNAGDLTGYYPDINLVINQLKEKKVKNILGNHDRYLVEKHLPTDINPAITAPFEDNLNKITSENLAFLKKLPPNKTFKLDGLKIGLYHGSPFDPDEYIFPDEPLMRFKNLNFDLLILGHTHWPMIKKVGKMMVVNPGSVGQPRDYDPRASYAILDTKSKKIEIKRLKYNTEETIRKIEKLGFDPELKDVLLRKRKS